MLSTLPDSPPAAPPVPRAHCANCGAPVPAKYCGECGQRNATRLVSLRQILWEVLDDQLSLNSALPSTLAGLLLRPGYLTREYVQGRIVRYMPPFRLYVMASLAFFLLLAFRADPTRIVGEGLHVSVDGGSTVSVTHTTAPRKRSPLVDYGALGDPARVAPWMQPVARRLHAQQERLNAMPKPQAITALLAAAEANAPKAIFLLLPVFALLLKLLYFRQRRLYVEHFVFALHLHAFAFMAFTVMLLTGSGLVVLALGAWLLAYTYLALRRVYGQGHLRTGAKYLVLGWVYLTLLLFALATTIAVSTLTV